MDKEELDCKDVRSCTIVWQLLDDVQERWKWLIQLILAAAVTITVQALSPLWPLSFEFKVDVINLVTSGSGPRLVIPEWATDLGPGKTIWMPFSSRCCHYRVWFSGSVTRRVWQCDSVTVKMVTWSRVTILTRSRLSGCLCYRVLREGLTISRGCHVSRVTRIVTAWHSWQCEILAGNLRNTLNITIPPPVPRVSESSCPDLEHVTQERGPGQTQGLFSDLN